MAGDREGPLAKPEIIGSARSSYTRIARMACEEKGVDYTLTEAELGAPEVFAIHPFGRMPVLRHGDFALCESKAIATYLDRAFPGPELIPSDPRLGALAEQWVSLVNTMMDPLLVRTYLLAYAFPRTADGKPDRAAIDAMLPRVREQLALLDRAVAATGFLVGDRFTLADIYVMAVLHYLKRLPESGQMLDASTPLGRYHETHAARPSFVRTIPPMGPPRRYTPPG
jgi:glutathione S-transferase